MLTDGLSFLNDPRIETLAPAQGAAYPSDAVAGQLFFRSDLKELYYYSGDAWVKASGSGGSTQLYDISLFVEGKPTASAVVLSFIAPRAYALPQNFLGSQAKASTASTDAVAFVVSKNGGSIGYIRFAADSTNGTFEMGQGITFAIGDLLTITAPSSADATLANISVTIPATLS